ncbi:uncharacterized protein LOC143565194 [Bidens hawaiensis]|uniref:uncharacterized protein LOC143565194 n=1 Tax=Bidens hawaiensis TaxID=980011 RepID=UPI00404943AC
MEARMSSLPYAQLCCQFSLDEILSATQNFDVALVVGEGGFGKVYKGTINVENEETFVVAIKRLNFNSSQGATEFWAEVQMLTKLRHCNLVSLIGYCNDSSEMILVYEFMPNGTLNDHLHKYETSLSWIQRLRISIGAARGLHYLHTGTGTQQGVIHRDVKSLNILLDECYSAKISDFGLSKIGPINASSAYINTRVKGTFGYLDPEYSWTGRLTRKTDVFAFGVVLFELLCGRPALDYRVDEDNCSLAKWAHESVGKGKVYEIIDLNIKSQISPKCLKVFARIADRCLSIESKKRPTMTEVLADLELSLKLQIKFDSIEKHAGLLSVARMLKWPFISPEVNSAQSDGKLPTVNEDTKEHTSSSKEDSVDHGEVATSEETLDRSDYHLDVSSAGDILLFANNDLKEVSFDDLKKATRDFTHAMRLGGGEFGDVFEGWINTSTSSRSATDDPLRIAIKRFYHSKIQHHLEEKFVDMEFLREFDHPNLIKVLGCCLCDKKLYLIYEFMDNGSLVSHLFTKDKIPLPWKTRVQIALGVAEALSFLHQRPYTAKNFSIKIHQILLDKNFNAKISDLESARLAYGDSYKEYNIDPLYYWIPRSKFLLFNLEYEGFIDSFGVVLIQMLTGEKMNFSMIAKLHKSMWDKKRQMIRKENLRSALDPHLPNVDDSIIKEAMELAHLAFKCLDNGHDALISALDFLKRISKNL